MKLASEDLHDNPSVEDRFDDVESDLRSEYERSRGTSKLAWEEAKSAARAAWNRVERALPGDADDDGR